MEEHQPAAHTTPKAEQQQQEAVASPTALPSTNDPAEDDGSPPLPAEAALLLPGGPRTTGLHIFATNVKNVFKLDELGAEVLGIAVPASLALTADPLASLIDTAFVGRLGSVEIAAVGVAIALFNQVMKVCIYPLVSVTTSFVAEEEAVLSKNQEEGTDRAATSTDSAELAAVENGDRTVSGEASPAELAGGGGCAAAVGGRRKGGRKKGKFLPSVTSALIVGSFLGLFQTALLVAAGKPLLTLMGVKPVSMLHGKPFPIN
jgi:hypothetical protein